MCRGRRAVLIIAAVACAVGASPPVAGAARPPAGSRYLFQQRPSDAYPGEPVSVGALQVSSDGRSLISHGFPVPAGNYGDRNGGSYVEIPLRCPGSEVEAGHFPIGAPAHHPVRIDLRGRFAVAARSDPGYFFDVRSSATARVSGHFSSRKLLDVVVSRIRFHAGPGNRRCRVRPHKLRFKLRAMPPFGGCGTAPGKTVLEDAGGRVYTNWGVDEEGKSASAYACRFGGKPVLLGTTPLDQDFWSAVGMFELASPFMSYVDSWAPAEAPHPESLVVVDLRGDASVVNRFEAIPDASESVFAPSFAKTVLTAKGSAAWVSEYCRSADQCSSGPASIIYDVWIADTGGARRVDAGAGIDPKSLALSGSQVAWAHDGEQRSIPIDL